MNKAKLIEGLNMIVEGVNSVITELSSEDTTATKKVETKTDSKSTATSKKEVKEVKEEKTSTSGAYTKEELAKMKFNDLKQLGASLGVSCKGTRDEITDRILNADSSSDSEPSKEDKNPEDKVVKFEDKKKLGKKTVEKEPEISEENMKTAREVVEQYDVKDVIAALAEVGITAKGKKSDLIPIVAKALQDGVLTLDDEEEDEEPEESEEDGDEEDFDLEADSYFSDYDLGGVNDPESDSMTDERLESIKSKVQEIIDSIEDESLKEEDIASYIEDNASDKEKELLGDDYTSGQLISLYVELIKKTIDDEGVEHEPNDPYVIGEENFCCGHKLKYVKKQNKFVCEQCGEEYEND